MTALDLAALFYKKIVQDAEENVGWVEEDFDLTSVNIDSRVDLVALAALALDAKSPSA